MKIVRKLYGRIYHEGYDDIGVSEPTPFRSVYKEKDASHCLRTFESKGADGKHSFFPGAYLPLIELESLRDQAGKYVLRENHVVQYRYSNENGKDCYAPQSEYRFNQSFFVDEPPLSRVLNLPSELSENYLTIQQYQDISEHFSTDAYPSVILADGSNKEYQDEFGKPSSIEEAKLAVLIWRAFYERYESANEMNICVYNADVHPLYISSSSEKTESFDERWKRMLEETGTKLNRILPEAAKGIVSIAIGVPANHLKSFTDTSVVFLYQPEDRIDCWDLSTEPPKFSVTEEDRALFEDPRIERFAEMLMQRKWPALFEAIRKAAPFDADIPADFDLITLCMEIEASNDVSHNGLAKHFEYILGLQNYIHAIPHPEMTENGIDADAILRKEELRFAMLAKQDLNWNESFFNAMFVRYLQANDAQIADAYCAILTCVSEEKRIARLKKLCAMFNDKNENNAKFIKLVNGLLGKDAPAATEKDLEELGSYLTEIPSSTEGFDGYMADLARLILCHVRKEGRFTDVAKRYVNTYQQLAEKGISDEVTAFIVPNAFLGEIDEEKTAALKAMLEISSVKEKATAAIQAAVKGTAKPSFDVVDRFAAFMNSLGEGIPAGVQFEGTQALLKKAVPNTALYSEKLYGGENILKLIETIKQTSADASQTLADFYFERCVACEAKSAMITEDIIASFDAMQRMGLNYGKTAEYAKNALHSGRYNADIRIEPIPDENLKKIAELIKSAHPEDNGEFAADAALIDYALHDYGNDNVDTIKEAINHYICSGKRVELSDESPIGNWTRELLRQKFEDAWNVNGKDWNACMQLSSKVPYLDDAAYDAAYPNDEEPQYDFTIEEMVDVNSLQEVAIFAQSIENDDHYPRLRKHLMDKLNAYAFDIQAMVGSDKLEDIRRFDDTLNTAKMPEVLKTKIEALYAECDFSVDAMSELDSVAAILNFGGTLEKTPLSAPVKAKLKHKLCDMTFDEKALFECDSLEAVKKISDQLNNEVINASVFAELREKLLAMFADCDIDVTQLTDFDKDTLAGFIRFATSLKNAKIYPPVKAKLERSLFDVNIDEKSIFPCEDLSAIRNTSKQLESCNIYTEVKNRLKSAFADREFDIAAYVDLENASIKDIIKFAKEVNGTDIYEPVKKSLSRALIDTDLDIERLLGGKNFSALKSFYREITQEAVPADFREKLLNELHTYRVDIDAMLQEVTGETHFDKVKNLSRSIAESELDDTIKAALQEELSAQRLDPAELLKDNSFNSVKTLSNSIRDGRFSKNVEENLYDALEYHHYDIESMLGGDDFKALSGLWARIEAADLVPRIKERLLEDLQAYDFDVEKMLGEAPSIETVRKLSESICASTLDAEIKADLFRKLSQVHYLPIIEKSAPASIMAIEKLNSIMGSIGDETLSMSMLDALDDYPFNVEAMMSDHSFRTIRKLNDDIARSAFKPLLKNRLVEKMCKVQYRMSEMLPEGDVRSIEKLCKEINDANLADDLRTHLMDLLHHHNYDASCFFKSGTSYDRVFAVYDEIGKMSDDDLREILLAKLKNYPFDLPTLLDGDVSFGNAGKLLERLNANEALAAQFSGFGDLVREAFRNDECARNAFIKAMKEEKSAKNCIKRIDAMLGNEKLEPMHAALRKALQVAEVIVDFTQNNGSLTKEQVDAYKKYASWIAPCEITLPEAPKTLTAKALSRMDANGNIPWGSIVTESSSGTDDEDKMLTLMNLWNTLNEDKGAAAIKGDFDRQIESGSFESILTEMANLLSPALKRGAGVSLPNWLNRK